MPTPGYLRLSGPLQSRHSRSLVPRFTLIWYGRTLGRVGLMMGSVEGCAIQTTFNKMNDGFPGHGSFREECPCPHLSQEHIFKKYPVLNETIVYRSSIIDLVEVPLFGGTLVKTVYLSIDPYLRGRMREVSSQPYVNEFTIGKPISNFGIGKVIRSEKDGVYPDDFVYVQELPFQEYNVLLPEHPLRVIKEEPGIPLSAYVGVLGMPGQTAFYGLELVGKPVAGETIFVSSGASAVGSLVIQLAKAKGLKVISSVGSDDKVNFLGDIGADIAFNYKKENIADVLAKEGPIDIYWDNVGGSTLEAALDSCKVDARVVVCGAMSQYNAPEPYAIKNAIHILFKRLKVEGFFVISGEQQYEGRLNDPTKFLNALVPLIQSGQIKWSEQVYKGIESVGEGIVAVQTGVNTAKVVIEV